VLIADHSPPLVPYTSMCSSGDAPATRAGLDVPEVFIHVRKSDHFTEFAIAVEATPTQCRFEVRGGDSPTLLLGRRRRTDEEADASQCRVGGCNRSPGATTNTTGIPESGRVRSTASGDTPVMYWMRRTMSSTVSCIEVRRSVQLDEQ